MSFPFIYIYIFLKKEIDIVVPTNTSATLRKSNTCVLKILVVKYNNERFENPHHEIVGKI